MTDNNHPITPPLKLFREWTEYRGTECEDQFWWRIATQAARWGADQELEACCKLLELSDSNAREFLTAARRLKPPSLKEQALEAQQRMWNGTSNHDDWNLIRRALEQLND